MKQSRKKKQRLAAGFLGGILGALSVFGGAVATCAQADQQGVILEKSAVWVSPHTYEAAIDLKVSGIERYTQKEVPISVIPILDVWVIVRLPGITTTCFTIGWVHLRMGQRSGKRSSCLHCLLRRNMGRWGARMQIPCS